ncbi:unnamed protein product, partial [Ectocarpus sp. 12 AP-2014]
PVCACIPTGCECSGRWTFGFRQDNKLKPGRRKQYSLVTGTKGIPFMNRNVYLNVRVKTALKPKKSCPPLRHGGISMRPDQHSALIFLAPSSLPSGSHDNT